MACQKNLLPKILRGCKKLKGEIKKEGWQNTTPPFYWANMESKHQSIKFFGYLYKM